MSFVDAAFLFLFVCFALLWLINLVRSIIPCAYFGTKHTWENKGIRQRVCSCCHREEFFLDGWHYVGKANCAKISA